MALLESAIVSFHYEVFLAGQVFIPKIVYIGQKPNRLVAAKMTESTISAIPISPVTVPV